MEHQRCAQCRNPIRGRQASVTHALSSLSFHADCWLQLHQRVQAEYAGAAASDGLAGLLKPYGRSQLASWLPAVTDETVEQQPA